MRYVPMGLWGEKEGRFVEWEVKGLANVRNVDAMDKERGAVENTVCSRCLVAQSKKGQIKRVLKGITVNIYQKIIGFIISSRLFLFKLTYYATNINIVLGHSLA